MSEARQNWRAALKTKAQHLQRETLALAVAFGDRRTPWYAKALSVLIVVYAVSPIDLIPDFIPVLGYLDDLILLPAGIALALRLIPAEVMAEARLKAGERLEQEGSLRKWGVVLVAAIWTLLLVIVGTVIYAIVKD